jgi:CRP/FNR family transcriptional regulator
LQRRKWQFWSGRVSIRRFERGELLFSEGDPGTGSFLMASGKIRIFKLSSSGREQVLTVGESGSSFAELPVFDGGKYPASASVLGDFDGENDQSSGSCV